MVGEDSRAPLRKDNCGPLSRKRTSECTAISAGGTLEITRCMSPRTRCGAAHCCADDRRQGTRPDPVTRGLSSPIPAGVFLILRSIGPIRWRRDNARRALLIEEATTTIHAVPGHVTIDRFGNYLISLSRDACPRPVRLTLVQNRLEHISRQMGRVSTRTARSPIFSQSHDFSCFGQCRRCPHQPGRRHPHHTGGGGLALEP